MKRKTDLLCTLRDEKLPFQDLMSQLNALGVYVGYCPPCIGFTSRFYIRRRHALRVKKAFPTVTIIISRHRF